MKIGLVTSWHVKCGIASYSEALSKALAEQDVEVYIIRIPRFGLKIPEVFQKIAERIPEEVELVHVQNEYGLFFGIHKAFYNTLREHNKPIITTMHATGNFEVDPTISKLSDAVIVHNEHCSKLFNFKCTIIHHGIWNKECVPPEVAKQSYGIDPRVPIVGYLGFISPYKGLETLINAMVKVPEAALLVAGGGHTNEDTAYIAELKDDSLKRLSGRCQWIGYVPDEKLAYAYGTQNILIYPSRYVSESGALLTGIGFGKAIIARNLSPIVEKEKEHALMTFNDEKDLEEKIHMLLSDAEAKKKLEVGARNYAEANSWDAVAKRHISFYEHILDEGKRNAADTRKREDNSNVESLPQGQNEGKP